MIADKDSKYRFGTLIYLKNRRYDDATFTLKYHYSEAGKVGFLFRFRDPYNYYSFEYVP
jgi:hypothetical protein